MTDEEKIIKEEYEKFHSTILGYDLDVNQIDKAWNFAVLAHHGQKRNTGEPFALHGLEVAKNLYKWRLDTKAIIAGILHDAVEDGGAKKEDISKEFGDEVWHLVNGVTKISDLKLRGSKNEEFVENLRKMFLAMAKDLRVILVKLADRLHNMETLYGVPEMKRKRIAEETLQIYAPLAERLGMGEIKSELDDLAFPYVYPLEYERVRAESKSYYKDTEKHVEKMKRTLLAAFARAGLKPSVSGRKKHLYSLWRKLERPEIAWDFSKIHDIVALRVIVDSITDCYTVLGIVHGLYKPVPHLGISDFIAQPKPNGYRSIHTKVFGIGGRITEIQIRSKKMHEEAEFGIAAHWFYSGIKSKEGVSEEKLTSLKYDKTYSKLYWVRELANWQKEIKDHEEYLNALRFDALSSRIFIFSPKGDVYDLPNGATPIDFAYAVHTGLSGYVKGAKVNGRIVSLNYKLISGDVVEIIKTKNYKPPSEGWLNFVKTTGARREIERSLRKMGTKV